jgi:hypothetical protein
MIAHGKLETEKREMTPECGDIITDYELGLVIHPTGRADFI